MNSYDCDCNPKKKRLENHIMWKNVKILWKNSCYSRYFLCSESLSICIRMWRKSIKNKNQYAKSVKVHLLNVFCCFECWNLNIFVLLSFIFFTMYSCYSISVIVCVCYEQWIYYWFSTFAIAYSVICFNADAKLRL